MSGFKEADNAVDILSVDDAASEVVEVPEWKLNVRVRGMSGTERDEWEASLVKLEMKGKKQTREMTLDNIRAKLLVRCIVKPSGERMFSDAQVASLGKKHGAALDRLYGVARRLSGIGDEEVEELAGNSDAGQSGAST